MQALVLAVVGLVPLVITPGLFFYFDITPKIIILLFSVSAMSCFCNENVNNIRGLLKAAPGRWFATLLAATWTAALVSTLLSSERLLSLNGSGWRRYGLISETAVLLFALLSAAWLAADSRRVRVVLTVATASGSIAALYGIAQYFGGDPLLPAKSYQIGEGILTIVRPPGTLGHADYFASWLLIVTFCSLALEGRLARVISVLAPLAILLSGTRSALLGLSAGGLVFFILRRPRLGGRALAAGLVCAAGLTGFFFSPAGTKLRARLHWSMDDVAGGARLLLWRDSLRMSTDRPLAGFGAETFTTDFPRYQSLELARAYPDFYHESPHNLFLDAVTSQGILGLLPLLGLCGLGLWCVRRASPPLAAALVATLVCQQFIVFVVPTALYFYLLLAMALAASIKAVPPAPPVRAGFPAQIISIAMSLLLASFGLRLLVADRALAAAQLQMESGNASAAAQAYRTSLKWQPGGTGTDLYYSRRMAQLAASAPIFATRLEASREALDAGIRAVSTSEDRANAWYNLAALLAQRDDAAGVERSLRNAIAWAPNWFKPHWTLAQLLEVEGRHEEALAAAAAAVDRDGGHDPEVSETWKRLHKPR
jgi:O-antigen ligase